MYLRWQRRGRRWRSDPGTTWSAVVVESVRVDGRPRQRRVAYLGTITEHGISKVCVRGWYWDKLTDRLNALSNRYRERIGIILRRLLLSEYRRSRKSSTTSVCAVLKRGGKGRKRLRLRTARGGQAGADRAREGSGTAIKWAQMRCLCEIVAPRRG